LDIGSSDTGHGVFIWHEITLAERLACSLDLELRVKRFSCDIPLSEDNPDDFAGYEVLIEFDSVTLE
jgi:hypothetical protein